MADATSDRPDASRSMDARSAELDELIDRANHASVRLDRSIVQQIDDALRVTTESRDLGRLLIAKASALQCHGRATQQAEAARAAVPHFVAVGDIGSAAYASAMAAVFHDQIDATDIAVDHAVESMVMLDRVELDDVPAVRASLALAGFLSRWAAFDLAIDIAARAFVVAQVLDGVPTDTVAFSFGYVAAEGAHVATDASTRERRLRHARKATTWLAMHGSTAVARQLFAPGLDGEIALVSGVGAPLADIETGVGLYPHAAPDLVAWHLLVRGCLELRDGRVAESLELFDESIPGLQASADNHCLVRALRNRSIARAATGDVTGALADSNLLVECTRRWQIDRVGHLAELVARRAELETSSTVLRNRADRLAEDLDTDALTGVRSRRWLEHRLSLLEQNDRHGSVIMLDIDRFKRVNDVHGHHVGDDVLHDFGTLIGAIDDGRHPVARFGGEEFAVLVDDDVDGTSGAALAERIRETVATHDWGELIDGLSLTVSCGVATGPMSEMRELLVEADDALLESKRSGRNRVMLFRGRRRDPSLFG